MDISLIIEKCYDEDEIMKVLKSPCVWEVINDFDLNVDDLKLDFANELYLLIKDNTVCVGVYILKNITSYIVDVHPAIIKKYRRKYAYKSYPLIESYIKNDFKHVKALTGFVPSLYKNAVSFAKSVGFTKLGVIPNATIRDNKEYGITVLYKGL